MLAFLVFFFAILDLYLIFTQGKSMAVLVVSLLLLFVSLVRIATAGRLP